MRTELTEVDLVIVQLSQQLILRHSQQLRCIGLTQSKFFNTEVGQGPRGRTSGNRRPSLPDGWLDSCDLDGEAAALVAAAEISVSGG